ncbi:hypothetical protein HPP92_018987 [Vanilla planifolia]|uniref:Uncharacterized protein n=1 Tax=Vanilla planifolia TaxID=51239 RepID=A0A835Q9F8_VANPL|nr:hypothetical protein HPP92_018987 [Vanilla planifolia]
MVKRANGGGWRRTGVGEEGIIHVTERVEWNTTLGDKGEEGIHRIVKQRRREETASGRDERRRTSVRGLCRDEPLLEGLRRREEQIHRRVRVATEEGEIIGLVGFQDEGELLRREDPRCQHENEGQREEKKNEMMNGNDICCIAQINFGPFDVAVNFP